MPSAGTRALGRANWDVEGAVELLFEGEISDGEGPGDPAIVRRRAALASRLTRISPPCFM